MLRRPEEGKGGATRARIGESVDGGYRGGISIKERMTSGPNSGYIEPFASWPTRVPQLPPSHLIVPHSHNNSTLGPLLSPVRLPSDTTTISALRRISLAPVSSARVG